MTSVTSGYTSIVTVASVKAPAPDLLSEMFALTGNTHPDALQAPEFPLPPLKFVNELFVME